MRADLGEYEHLISERTGLALNPAHPVVKLAWLRRHVTSDGVVSASDSWLLHQLTGEFVTEVSVASRSLLADPGAPGWDLDLLGLLGLADQQMPAVLPSDRIIGTTIAFGGTVLVGGVVSNRTAVLAGRAACNRGGHLRLRLRSRPAREYRCVRDHCERGPDELGGMAGQGRDDLLHRWAGRLRPRPSSG